MAEEKWELSIKDIKDNNQYEENRPASAISESKVDGRIANSTVIDIDNSQKDSSDVPESFPSYLSALKRAYQVDTILENRNCRKLILIVVFMLYNAYLGLAIHYTWSQTKSWCDGIKFLVILTIILYTAFAYYLFLKRLICAIVSRLHPACNFVQTILDKKYTTCVIAFLLAASVATFLVIDSTENRMRLVSCIGLAVLLMFGFVFSKHRSKIAWRQVLWGLSVQFIFGLCILRSSVGKDIFYCIGKKAENFLAYTDRGSSFVFGYLATGELLGDIPKQIGVFAFSVIPVTIFFSFCVSILYYYGVMQLLVLKVGWFLQKTIGTTACESVSAAANIFLGMIDAPIIIRPYLRDMTRSEIHAIMTGGFATIAGGVLAAYISFGINAGHLLSASVMSAPAALAFSKLVYPETEVSKTAAEHIVIIKCNERNAIEAGANGVTSVIPICANIVANLIAFVSFLHFVDTTFAWFGSLVGYDFLTFQWLLSQILTPLAFLMGVDWKESQLVARLVGIKTIVNEFVAYRELAEMKSAGIISPRAEYIATYALCGFSNFSAIGILIGGFGALVPERKSEITQLALSAMLSGSAACFMTACIAGMLLDVPGSQVFSEGQELFNITTMNSLQF